MSADGRHRLAPVGIALCLVLVAAVLVCIGTGLFSHRQEEPLPAVTASQPEESTDIQFECDDELRGRMVRVMTRRAAETPASDDPQDVFLQKLCDGTLLRFAEAARAVWPEMDISILSDCLLFEDEQEKASFMALSGRLIGSVRIDKPEDITYWVNRETLSELLPKDDGQ